MSNKQNDIWNEAVEETRSRKMEAEMNLYRVNLKNVITEEIWKYHELSEDFMKKHSLNPRGKLVTEINELCLNSHNEVLEMIIKKYL